jgi:hypothetical protein
MGFERESSTTGAPMRWAWVVVGVVFGAVVIVAFLNLVDRYLDRPAVDVLVGSLTVILVGIFVGAASRGEALREAAVAGLMLAVLTLALIAFQMRVPVSTPMWVAGPFGALLLALLGGFVGEMLQGTLDEAYVDRPIDWPWVFVSVVVGFTLSTYALFLTHALLPASPAQDAIVLTGAFLVTGVLVGFYSPGKTMVEPGIAAAGLILAHIGFLTVFVEAPPSIGWLALAFAVGTGLALAGGWMGEALQARVRKR